MPWPFSLSSRAASRPNQSTYGAMVDEDDGAPRVRKARDGTPSSISTSFTSTCSNLGSMRTNDGVIVRPPRERAPSPSVRPSPSPSNMDDEHESDEKQPRSDLKAACLVILCGGVLTLFVAFVGGEYPLAEAGTADSAGTVWILTSSALVLLMTPGLGFFYGGMVKDTNVLNTLMMSTIAIALIMCQWTLCGYSLSFGHYSPARMPDGSRCEEHGPAGSGDAPGCAHGLFVGGPSYFFLNGVGGPPGDIAPAVPQISFMTFQMTFAVLTPAIISGAVVERMRFEAFTLFILLWSTFVYDPVCHWVWGGGWMSWHVDFAGGTVVHISSGVSAYVAGVAIGKRRSESRTARGEAHNVPLVLLGGFLLWVGWTGFNGGSAITGFGVQNAVNGLAALAVATTTISAAAGMIAWVACEALTSARPSALGAMCGAVGGLVSITPSAGYVPPLAAMPIGAIGSACSFAMTGLLRRLDIADDGLDVGACHGVCGVVGSVLCGVFASSDVNPAAGVHNGLLYGGGPMMLLLQVVAVSIVTVYSGVVTCLILMLEEHVLGGVRVSAEEEAKGLDIGQHSTQAYAQKTYTLANVNNLAVAFGLLQNIEQRSRGDEERQHLVAGPPPDVASDRAVMRGGTASPNTGRAYRARSCSFCSVAAESGHGSGATTMDTDLRSMLEDEDNLPHMC